MQSSFWTSMPGVAGATLFLKKLTRQALTLSACIVMSAPMTGCGGASPQTNATPDVVNPENSAENGTAPPNAEIRPLKPGQVDRPLGKDGLPQLQAKGINYEQLFTERLSDDRQRFERVENAVLDLRRDFEAVLPSVMRLVAVEADIKNLVGQLETLLQNEPLPGPMDPADSLPANPVPPVIEDMSPEPGAEPASDRYDAALHGTQRAQSAPLEIKPEEESSAIPAPTPATPAPKPAAPTPPVTAPVTPPVAAPEPAPAPVTAAAPAPTANPAGPAVSGIRFGVDGGKTRIVFDADAAITYKKDLDNAEKLLVIELPGLAWRAAPSGTAPASAHVQSWTAQPMAENGGTRIIMILNKSASLAYEAALNPEPSNPHYRLVLDLR